MIILQRPFRLLRETVPAGDTYYAGLHKVYTIWFCNAYVHFMSYSTKEICRSLNRECYLYIHKHNIRTCYDEFPEHVIPAEPESDLIEIDFVELPVLRRKVWDGKAENYEKLFLQFMESIESSVLLMEKEYGVELMKYKKGVSDAMNLAERYELKLEKEREEADKKAVFSTVSV